MNGSPQPSQLVEQVKLLGREAFTFQHVFLCSEQRWSNLEKKVFPLYAALTHQLVLAFSLQCFLMFLNLFLG